MKVRVNPIKCQGYGRCVEVAPELFDLDDFGFAQAAADGAVPDGREHLADEAIRECPAQAIASEQ